MANESCSTEAGDLLTADFGSDMGQALSHHARTDKYSDSYTLHSLAAAEPIWVGICPITARPFKGRFARLSKENTDDFV